MNIKFSIDKSYQQFVINLAVRKSPILKFYLTYFWQPKPNTLPYFIEHFAKKNNIIKFSFLQIGANNGYQHDPMFKLLQRNPHWQGILVEPQKDVFVHQLLPLYEQYENLQLVNAAIAPANGYLPFYKIAFSNERWATGLASFDRKTIEKHIQSGYIEQQAHKQGVPLPKNLADYITTEQVTCISFESLIKQYSISQLDLLLIDTEGFDFEILKMIDFAKFKPQLIAFEYIHLSPQDLTDCKKLLHGNNYELCQIGRDLVASRQGI